MNKKINFFSNHSILTILEIFIILLILFEIYYRFSVVNSILNTVIFILILILILFFNLSRIKCTIELDKLEQNINRVKFPEIQGSDGLCCFLSYRDTGVPFNRNKEQLLIRLSLSTKIDKDNIIFDDVIYDSNIKFFTYGKKCSKLKLKYQKENNNIYFHYYCGVYENRPRACREYPKNGCGNCHLGKYLTSPTEHLKHFKYVTVFFLCFEQKKFPELSEFSSGYAGNFFTKYYLIPVPLHIKGKENLLCTNNY